MKAAQFSKYGGPEVIVINPEAPTPQLKGGQILIENYAASINPFDATFREGYMKESIQPEFPVTIGGDFAGRVKALGPSVAGFNVADAVFGQALAFTGASGTMAEKVIATATNIALAPNGIPIEDAAALPLAGVSALQAIEEHLQLKPDQKILIHGGAGGIGHLAIQLAKAMGAYVITTVSDDNLEFVTELGADETIDYKSQNFTDIVAGVDAVFDIVGGDVTERSLGVLRDGGILVTMKALPSVESVDKAKERLVTVIAQVTQVNHARLNRLSTYVSEGKIKVTVERMFTLDEAREAYQHAEKESRRGKVVVRMK